MSTIIKFDLKELKKLATDKNSCVVEKKVTQNLALQPWCLGNLKESIKNRLDYKVGKYDKEFSGILLSYKNLRVLSNVGSIKNDSADIQFQVQADYFIFQPFVGAVLKGVVNKKFNTHLGILVHRVFNVVIPRPTDGLASGWTGSEVREGQEVVFRVVVLDLYGALPYIRGELDESLIKMGSEGDDEMGEMKQVEPVSVSYVNFDKTKPYYRKQIGDGLPQTSSKNTTKIITKAQTPSRHQEPLKNQAQLSKNENCNSNASLVKKVKKQNKISDASDAIEPPPRQTKKHRRES